MPYMMVTIVRIFFPAGDVTLPAECPYDRELVYEYICYGAQQHMAVSVQVAGPDAAEFLRRSYPKNVTVTADHGTVTRPSTVPPQGAESCYLHR